MKTFKEFAESVQHTDAGGTILTHGDYVHNPHTGDVGQLDVKRSKIVYHDGSKVDAKRAGLKDWWHRISKHEYESRAAVNKKADQSQAELKSITSRLSK